MTTHPERLAAALADRYRIERELGAGGMATVYLAEDLKHRRRVAVKVLKPELAAVLGAERFVQEITTTAALQHPHILPLFDSGEADGFLFYVMPFVDGETLRSKLDRETQLGVEEAVRIASDVADALHYAHSNGVIHRDIKPENILLANGRPMVADFGIALAVSAAAGGRMTETGLSLGTPHYMSPEQATAEKEIGARSDVYSLASVLYEMLAGQPPHTGGSAQQIIMKIITETPAPVTQYRKSVPPNVAAAIAKALEKLPADRFESAQAFADALANLAFTPAAFHASHPAAPTSRSWRTWLTDPRSWAALLALAMLGSIALPNLATSGRSNAEAATLRFSIQGPADSSILAIGAPGFWNVPVISSDGRLIAFGAHTSAGHVIYLRALDSFEAVAIPGEGRGPFFSPNNAAVAFFRGAEVWTADVAERVATRVGALSEIVWDITSAVWHPDGRILVAGARGLWALPATGGEATLLVATDSTGRERFDDVNVVRDGRILLNVDAGPEPRTEVVTADGRTRVRIATGLEQVQVVEDIMFYTQGGQTRATRFDLKRLEPVGTAVALQDHPATRSGRSIVWVEGSGLRDLEHVWVSRNGEVTPLGIAPGFYRWPRVAPDGNRIAFGVSLGPAGDLRTIVLRTGATARVAGGSEPVWSIDGRHVFTSRGNRPLGGLIMHIADGSRAPDTLLALDRGDAWPTGLSPDGRWLAYYGATLGAGEGSDATDPNDLMFMDLTTRESRRIRLTGAQRGARFSSDGRWVAYQSTESGGEEVYVRPWPDMDVRYQVSTDGGIEPVWAPDGNTLYYRHRDAVLEMPITLRDGAIERAAPRVLFTGNFNADRSGDQSYDIAPDGRFLMLRPVPGGRMDLKVTLNWIDDVRARLDRAR
ncbi:MAG TPA: protein kinase [Longimicrobiales bacterium]|nr:protein kinase [Longimicrobiales bacterium]